MSKVKSRTVFVPPKREGSELDERINDAGLRPTPQRRHVYGVLLDKQDHPTAEDVYLRSREGKPEISMATVYNCLDALVKCSLVKQVKTDQAATRYCPNMSEHAHFHCEECGGIYDIEGSVKPRQTGLKMPRGFKIKQFEMSLRGICRECSEQ